MNKIILNFKGPFHFDDIDSVMKMVNGKSIIYIHGFISEKKINKSQKGFSIGLPANLSSSNILTTKNPVKSFDHKNYAFIPLYVGKDSNKKNNPKRRIRDHRNLLDPATRTTIRFTMSEMNNFFKSSFNFPINFGQNKSERHVQILNWINNGNKNKLAYVKDKNILDVLYENKLIIDKSSDLYIEDIYKRIATKIKDPIEDSLRTIYADYNNYWFAFAEIEKQALKKIGLVLEDLETFAFWALKGFTISKIKSISPSSELDQKVEINIDKKNENLKSIFKIDKNGIISSKPYSKKEWNENNSEDKANKIFPGYDKPEEETDLSIIKD